MALFDKFIRRAKTLTELIWGRTGGAHLIQRVEARAILAV